MLPKHCTAAVPQAKGVIVPEKSRPPFDPKSFLAKIGEGRGVLQCDKDQVVFSQGDVADAVFYIQKGKVKLTVVSEQGKEAVVAMLGTDDFFGEGCLAGQIVACGDGDSHRGHSHHAHRQSGDFARPS